LRLCTCAVLLSLLAVGCVAREEAPVDDLGATDQGLTEIRLDAHALLDAGVTRVTLESGSQTEDLELNPASGTYDGAILLPTGPQSLVARAFAGPTLVGASNPTAVNVVAGQVTRVMMRILDLTGSAPPLYGPILDSLVYPATAQAAAPVALTAAVVAPGGDPVTYAWSSSCADSVFSAPAAAATSWTKAAQGSCTIALSATSSGFTVSRSFQIVVFPAGSASGAVEASASFIAVPSLYLGFPAANCYISPGGNASCAGATASPSTTPYEVSVASWGGSTAGTITVSDNCGGQFGTSNTNPDYREGSWLPPLGASVCILTATATSSDGLVATLSAAVLVRAGTPPTAQPPTIFGQLAPGFNCVFGPGSPTSLDCGTVPAGTTVSMFGSIFWADGQPESVTLLDDCNGAPIQPSSAYNFSGSWSLPASHGQTCTLTIRARNLQGMTREATALYHLQ